MEKILMNTENSKMNESQKFVLNLSQDQTQKVQLNILLFKIYLFITCGKI